MAQRCAAHAMRTMGAMRAIASTSEAAMQTRLAKGESQAARRS